MSESVVGQLKAWFDLKLINPLLNGISAEAIDSARNTINITGGTGANQADRLWWTTGRVLASGASESINIWTVPTIDIGSGAGRDPLGQPFAMTELVGWLVRNNSNSIGTLLVGGEGTSNAWTSILADPSDKLKIPPSGFMLFGLPNSPAWVVGTAGNNLVKFAASGGDLNYDVHLLGRST